MPTDNRAFSFRIEEIPTVGRFVKDSYMRDTVDFVAYSPDFNPGYLIAYTDKQTLVEALVNPIQFTNEMKLITERLTKNMEALRPLLDRVEGYAVRAAGVQTPGVAGVQTQNFASLTIAPKDFGVKQ